MNVKDNRKPALQEGREAFLSPDEEYRTIGAISRIFDHRLIQLHNEVISMSIREC